MILYQLYALNSIYKILLRKNCRSDSGTHTRFLTKKIRDPQVKRNIFSLLLSKDNDKCSEFEPTCNYNKSYVTSQDKCFLYL